MKAAPVIDLVSFKIRKRQSEFEIRRDSRVNTAWTRAISYWYYIFEEIVALRVIGEPYTKENLLANIAWAKEESMKVFGISRGFKDPESLWFFAVCKDTLEPMAWRLARMRKRSRKIINIRSRTAEIIRLPVR